MGTKNRTLKEVLKANAAFYEAFAAGDFLAVKRLWSGRSNISVIHPGSIAQHGQEAVMMSWELIFAKSGVHEIECINEEAYLTGESAYVVCSEVFPEGQLIATNIFVFEDNEWRMIHHQAGSVSDRQWQEPASNVFH